MQTKNESLIELIRATFDDTAEHNQRMVAEVLYQLVNDRDHVADNHDDVGQNTSRCRGHSIWDQNSFN